MRHSFTFDGISSATYGVYAFPTDTLNSAPARQYTTLVVPGRSGSLLIDNERFDNIKREYGIIIPENSASNLAGLRNALASRAGYFRLEDTFDTTHYFMAVYNEPYEAVLHWRSGVGAKGVISFERKPQRFLKSGETVFTFTTNSAIENPTRFPSKPMLVVATSSSGGMVGIGDTSITISRAGTTYIDCDMGRAYYGATSMDSYVSLNAIDFPTLDPGSNGITVGTGVTRLQITPRWWEL